MISQSLLSFHLPFSKAVRKTKLVDVLFRGPDRDQWCSSSDAWNLVVITLIESKVFIHGAIHLMDVGSWDATGMKAYSEGLKIVAVLEALAGFTTSWFFHWLEETLKRFELGL